MIHNLRSENVLLIDPVIFENKCKQLDEFDLNAFLARQPGVLLNSSFTHDLWGNPLPKPEILPDGTAIIPIKGILYGDCPDLYEVFGFCNPFKILKWITEAAANPAVSAIVLHVDSPGGSTMGIAELANAIRDLQAEYGKRIIAFSSGTVASAAFWIVAACYGLFGTLSSQWGAIGAYRVHVNRKKLFDIAGIRVDIYRSGKFKGMGEDGTDLTPDHQAFIQARVDSNGESFRKHVESYRPIDRAEMEGQFYFAPDSASRGFIDDVVPGLREVLQMAGQ